MVSLLPFLPTSSWNHVSESSRGSFLKWKFDHATILIKIINESPLPLRETPDSEQGYKAVYVSTPPYVQAQLWLLPHHISDQTSFRCLDESNSFPLTSPCTSCSFSCKIFPLPFYWDDWQCPSRHSGSDFTNLSPQIFAKLRFTFCTSLLRCHFLRQPTHHLYVSPTITLRLLTLIHSSSYHTSQLHWWYIHLLTDVSTPL